MSNEQSVWSGCVQANVSSSGFTLLLLLMASCSAPRIAPADDPADKSERDIPDAIRISPSLHIVEARNYLWSREVKTLHFIGTNMFEGNRLSILAELPTIRTETPEACLRMRETSYKLTLGSAFCQRLATNLTWQAPTDPFSDLTAERIAALKDLLRGRYSYKNAPP
jgi:hypothetical protein